MRRVKLPRAVCLEVATAHPLHRPLLLQGLMLPARIVELGEEVLTTSRATAAETGASSSSSTRDEECQTSLGGLPRSRHCILHCFDVVAAGTDASTKIVELGEEV